jgi:hypothetical protein
MTFNGASAAKKCVLNRSTIIRKWRRREARVGVIARRRELQCTRRAECPERGGLLLLREVERRLELSDRLAACLKDPRAPEKVVPRLAEVIVPEHCCPSPAAAKLPRPRPRAKLAAIVYLISENSAHAGMRGSALPARPGI